MNANSVDTIISIMWLILAVVGILVSALKRREKKKKRADIPPPVPGKQPAQARDASETNQPKILRADLENFFREVAGLKAAAQQKKADEQKEEAHEPPVQASPPPLPKDIADAEPDAEHEMPAPSEKAHRARFPEGFRLSAREWQRAVVMSEILGPPIALRDHR